MSTKSKDVAEIEKPYLWGLPIVVHRRLSLAARPTWAGLTLGQDSTPIRGEIMK